MSKKRRRTAVILSIWGIFLGIACATQLLTVEVDPCTPGPLSLKRFQENPSATVTFNASATGGSSAADYWEWNQSGTVSPLHDGECELHMHFTAAAFYDVTATAWADGAWGQGTHENFLVFDTVLDVNGVDDEDEEDPGAYIALNDDDDDNNDTLDYDDDGDASEDDLVRIELVDCMPADLDVGSVRLEGIAGVRIWSDEHKGTGNLVIDGDEDEEWDLDSIPSELWLEGITEGSGDLELWYVQDGTTPDSIYNPDKVKVTVLTVDMDIEDVDDADEEDPGKFIALGSDDTNLYLNAVVGPPFDASHPMTLDVEYGGRGNAGTIQVWDYSDPANKVQLTLPKDYSSSGSLPADLRVKGDTATVNAQRLITLIWSYSIQGGTVEDRVKCTVVGVDLDIDGVDDEDEDDPGGYVTYNKDDDDENGTADYDDTGTVTDEDNLVKIEIGAPSSRPFGARVRLEVPFDQDEIRVWEDETKGTRVLPTSTGACYKEWGTSDTVPSELYVEGYSYVGGTCELKLSYFPDYIGTALAEDVVKFRIVDMTVYRAESGGTPTHELDDWPETATELRSPKYMFGKDDAIYVEARNLGINAATAETFTDIIQVESESGSIDLTLKETGANTNIFDNITAEGELLYLSDVTASGAGDEIGVVDEPNLIFSVEIQPDSGSYDSTWSVMVDRGEFATGAARSYDSLTPAEGPDRTPLWNTAANEFKNDIVDSDEGNLDWWAVGEVRGSYGGTNSDIKDFVINAGGDSSGSLEADIFYSQSHGEQEGSIFGTIPKVSNPTQEVYDFFLEAGVDFSSNSDWNNDLDWAIIKACSSLRESAGDGRAEWKALLKHSPRRAHGILGFEDPSISDYDDYIDDFMDEIGHSPLITSWVNANTASFPWSDQPYGIVYHEENADDCFRKASEGVSLTADVTTSNIRGKWRNKDGQTGADGFEGDIEEETVELLWDGQTDRKRIRFGRARKGLQKIQVSPHRFNIGELANEFSLVREYESGLLKMSRNLNVDAKNISKNEAVKAAKDFAQCLGLEKKNTGIETSAMHETGGTVMGYAVGFTHSYKGCMLAGDHVTMIVQSDGIKLVSAFWHNVEARIGRHEVGEFKSKDIEGAVGALRQFYDGIDQMPNVEYVRPVYNVFDPDTSEPPIIWNVHFENGAHIFWDSNKDEAADHFKGRKKQKRNER